MSNEDIGLLDLNDIKARAAACNKDASPGHPYIELLKMAVSLAFVMKINTRIEDTACVYFGSNGDLFTCHEKAIHCWSPQGIMTASVASPINGTINCIQQSPTCPNTFVYAVQNTVVFCDNRNWSSPVHTFTCNKDEINEVSFHPSGKYICAGDDSGEVKVLDIDDKKLFQTLNGEHDNICSTAVFSVTKKWELLSGGLDCKLLRWNFSIGRLVGATVVPEDLDEGGNCTVNPPFVYSIVALPVDGDSPLLACALGNGAVGLYSLKEKKAAKYMASSHLHSSSVVRVGHVRRNGRDLLVSGSNDGRIVISRVDCKDKRCAISDIASISHDSKINWLTVSKECCVCIADQTDFVSIYQIQ